MTAPVSAAEAAERAGIDLGLVDDNLRLSLEQRVLQHQAALDFALEVERAGQWLRERSARATNDTDVERADRGRDAASLDGGVEAK